VVRADINGWRGGTHKKSSAVKVNTEPAFAVPTRQPGEKRRMQGRHQNRSAVKKQEQAGRFYGEN